LEQATRFIVSCLESSRCYNSAISLPRRRPRHPSSWSALSGWGILFDDQVCALPSFRACLVSGAMPAFEILAEEPALDSGTPTTLPAKERKTGVRRFYALGLKDHVRLPSRSIRMPLYKIHHAESPALANQDFLGRAVLVALSPRSSQSQVITVSNYHCGPH
jgi:hypothetical protein